MNSRSQKSHNFIFFFGKPSVVLQRPLNPVTTVGTATILLSKETDFVFHQYPYLKSYTYNHLVGFLHFHTSIFSLLRIDQQHNQITPEDRLTVLCEITIDGKDVQQSGKALVSLFSYKLRFGLTLVSARPP
jgi:hypothetical protein